MCVCVLVCLCVCGHEHIYVTACSAVDLKNPPGAIYRGTPRNEKAGCTLTLSDELFVDMASGKITGQQVLPFLQTFTFITITFTFTQAFFQGKVKIGGNVMLSQKLQTLFAAQSKL